VINPNSSAVDVEYIDSDVSVRVVFVLVVVTVKLLDTSALSALRLVFVSVFVFAPPTADVVILIGEDVIFLSRPSPAGKEEGGDFDLGSPVILTLDNEDDPFFKIDFKGALVPAAGVGVEGKLGVVGVLGIKVNPNPAGGEEPGKVGVMRDELDVCVGVDEFPRSVPVVAAAPLPRSRSLNAVPVLVSATPTPTPAVDNPIRPELEAETELDILFPAAVVVVVAPV
jgi:hypothetical protein